MLVHCVGSPPLPLHFCRFVEAEPSKLHVFEWSDLDKEAQDPGLDTKSFFKLRLQSYAPQSSSASLD